MNHPQALVALRDALAELYTDAATARRVAGDAGLNLRQVSFSTRALDNWTAILDEAEKQDLVPNLIDIARKEYPRYRSLADAAAAYLAPTAAPATSPASPPAPSTGPVARSSLANDTIRQLTDALVPAGLATQSTIPFDWVHIPAGHFWMGSNQTQDPYALDNEMLHSAHLPEYRIARYPVTVAQFRRFTDSTGYRTTAEGAGQAADLVRGLTRDSWPPKKGAYWRQPHGPGSRAHDEHPVTCISWHDAVEFCSWAKVRLPSEAEWEKAAGWDPQAEMKRIYPWGNQAPAENRCNFNMNVGDTTPVERFPDGASWYGVLDMAGNVWEWTNSLYKKYPYALDDRESPRAAGEHVLRGGSFYQKAMNVRCAYRNYHRPEAVVSDYGFRVCAP